MSSVYGALAANLVLELNRKSVLVRDTQPIAERLEVPQYYCYYPFTFGHIRHIKYSPALSTGCEMLYTKKGKDIQVCEMVALHLPKEFPKTYAFLLKRHGTEHEIGCRIGSSLFAVSQTQSLITRTDIGKYIISEKVRKDRIVPDCLNIQTSNLDSPITVKQL